MTRQTCKLPAVAISIPIIRFSRNFFRVFHDIPWSNPGWRPQNQVSQAHRSPDEAHVTRFKGLCRADRASITRCTRPRSTFNLPGRRCTEHHLEFIASGTLCHPLRPANGAGITRCPGLRPAFNVPERRCRARCSNFNGGCTRCTGQCPAVFGKKPLFCWFWTDGQALFDRFGTGNCFVELQKPQPKN